MSVFEQYSPGLGSVGNYQVAGTPWLTSSTIPASGNVANTSRNSSTQHIQFPYVTKQITIENIGTGEICFTLKDEGNALGDGVNGGHSFTIPPSGSNGSPLSRVTLDMKTKEIFISNKHNQPGGFQVYASFCVCRVGHIGHHGSLSREWPKSTI